MTQLALHRCGESSHHPFRSDRLYYSDGAWYFLIRGGNSKGPYTTPDEAKTFLKNYVNTLEQLYEAFHKPTEDDHHHHS